MVRARPGRLAALALAGAAAAGCSSSKRSHDPPAVPGLAVTLDAPGAAPRRPLRYRFAVGATSRLELRLDLDLSVAVNGNAMAIPSLPGLSIAMEFTIVEVRADGSARWKADLARATVVETPGVSAASVAQLRDALGGVTRFTASGGMTASGALTEVVIERPPITDPQVDQYLGVVDQLIRQMACPLPAEAIGQGAAWQVRTELDNDGVKIDHVAVNQLVTVDGDRLEIRQTVREQAPRQVVADPAAPSTSTEVTSLAGGGTATVVVDLTRPWPRTYSLQFELDSAMTTSGPAQHQEVKVHMAMLAQATTAP